MSSGEYSRQGSSEWKAHSLLLMVHHCTMTMIHRCGFSRWIALIILVVMALAPREGWAHEMADRAWPAPDSVLDASPESIEIIFPDLLTDDGNRIIVQHQHGEVIIDQAPLVLRDAASSSLSIDLNTELSSGVYIVRWIAAHEGGWSEDGTYSFTVTAGDSAGASSDPDWLPWTGTAMGLGVIVAGGWWLSRRHHDHTRQVGSA